MASTAEREIAAYQGENMLNDLVLKILQGWYPELSRKSYLASGIAWQFLFKCLPF